MDQKHKPDDHRKESKRNKSFKAHSSVAASRAYQQNSGIQPEEITNGMSPSIWKGFLHHKSESKL